ncbi:hypothetical protein AVEN_30974-1 [Araneus ventricosus]|uniref:Uncharacterized protein n=2 Tax=Araneus ventricosus TaxID=182803 RepID=A0A4Y2RCY6_ARAVE|nr:hypothetical protein AVEN_30974-1 [Araneus ventricosus]
MADKGEQKEEKPTEQVPKNVDVPDIVVTEEGASGGTEDKDSGKKGVLRSFADKMKNIGHGKRSISTSPETRKDETHMEGTSSKKGFKLTRSPPSPSKKGIKDKVKRLFKSTSGKDCDEETENLCEQEFTEHSTTRLAPPEKDMGIASPSSATEPMAEKCDTYDRSSSVSSAPSGYSSLPDDDYDTDITSPDDLNSPEDGKQK